MSYVEYLGTDQYTPEELKKKFYQLGVSYNVSSSDDEAYIRLSGLEESLEEGVALLEHVLANPVVNDPAKDELVKDILKAREDRKKDHSYILGTALMNYAKYGKDSPLNYRLSEEELQQTSAKELVELITDLPNYQHSIFYYGSKKLEDVKEVVKKHHTSAQNLKAYPEKTDFEEVPIQEDEIYFVDRDMVQAQLILLSRGNPFSKDNLAKAQVFNNYLGGGMASIVFQEIREARALAYSAYAAFSIPDTKDKHHYTYGYLGTQVDKLPEATTTMLELLDSFPKREESFRQAKDAALRKIETNRITKASIFWNYRKLQRKGIDYDIRKDIYKDIQAMSYDELQQFFDAEVKSDAYKFLVIGDRETVNFEALKSFGKLKEMTVDELILN